MQSVAQQEARLRLSLRDHWTRTRSMQTASNYEEVRGLDLSRVHEIKKRRPKMASLEMIDGFIWYDSRKA